MDVPKCCEKLNGIECISKHAERDNDHDDSWFWMMPGNASGLGMGKDDYLTERILGINLSLTRERGMGLGRPELLHVPSFFIKFPKVWYSELDSRSAHAVMWMHTTECINHAVIMQYQIFSHILVFHANDGKFRTERCKAVQIIVRAWCTRDPWPDASVTDSFIRHSSKSEK